MKLTKINRKVKKYYKTMFKIENNNKKKFLNKKMNMKINSKIKDIVVFAEIIMIN